MSCAFKDVTMGNNRQKSFDIKEEILYKVDSASTKIDSR